MSRGLKVTVGDGGRCVGVVVAAGAMVDVELTLRPPHALWILGDASLQVHDEHPK